MLPTDDIGEARPIERDGSWTATASNDQHPVQELDQ
jgi:hypothetical protein